MAIQFVLPHVLTDFLPIDVHVSLVPSAVLTGLLVGGWIAMIFALRPLLALRKLHTDDSLLGMERSSGSFVSLPVKTTRLMSPAIEAPFHTAFET